MAESTDKLDKLKAVVSVKRGMVSFPETVFVLGGDLSLVDERLRELDVKKGLSLGNILDATPPVWTHVDAFSVMARMVTNGEYAEFLSHEDEEGSFYDSADLWRHVWNNLGFHMTSVQMPYRDADGQVRYFEEAYSACTSFVEAYLQSLHNEMQCVFLSAPVTKRGEGQGDLDDDMSVEKQRRPGVGARDFLDVGDDDLSPRGGSPPSRARSVSRDHLLRRVFAFVKSKLCESMAVDDDGSDALTDEERDLVGEYRDVQAALKDIAEVNRELRRGYGRQVDRRLVQAFKKGQVVIEPIQFLTRLAAAVRAEKSPALDSPVPLHLVFFPRRWRSPQGRARKRRFVGNNVPWEDCPVYGISLYEAVAYAAWLSSITGMPLTLPDEAQYERSSSWPRERPPADAKGIRLDPAAKLLFPWQNHCSHDFNHFFGREGREVEAYYQKDREVYTHLVESTSHRLGDGVALYQLEGFGWHWTRDRYDETERKYSRFRDPDYPRYTAAPCVTPGGRRAEVFHYAVNRSPTDSLFVLKGSPDVVGGPGLTTRRYAVYPMRGYVNVGFRLVCQEK